MSEGFSPSNDAMPPEFAHAEADAEMQDPGLTLETSTGDLRKLWSDWLCNKGQGAFSNPMFFGKSIGGVAVPAVDAFKALETALRSAGYTPTSSWSYNCRTIAGSANYSLHSFGIAIDLDPVQNPYSSGDKYSGRIKEPHVAAVLAIKNPRGRSVWSWGGNWPKHDRMHFQIDQGPTAVQVDWTTVPGFSGAVPAKASTSTPGGAVSTKSDPSITLQEETVLTRGNKGAAVERIQQYLMLWDPAALPEHGADGGYGSETIEWVKKYQEAMGLTVTGNIDGITAVMLSTEKAGVGAKTP